MNLAEAKQRLTIDALWTHFGFAGKPSKSCHCPLHEDGSKSFSVTPDGTLYNCFAGCGGGDAVDFYAAATGLPHAEACRAFIALAGGSSLPSTPRPPRPTSEEEAIEKATRRNQWPLFEAGNKEDLSRLAELRRVSIDGLRLMSSRGLLFFTEWHGHRAWVVTDDARKNAQVRRLDGLLWPVIEKKAQTLPGSEASRPIGAREAQQFLIVLFVEGGPDLLAAFHFIHAHGRQADVAAVAMLGSFKSIHPASLPIFGCGKCVRIFPHTDKPGSDAAAKWTEQLETMEATVDAGNFTGLAMEDGSPIADLNDCTRISTNQASELSNLIPDENKNR